MTAEEDENAGDADAGDRNAQGDVPLPSVSEQRSPSCSSMDESKDVISPPAEAIEGDDRSEVNRQAAKPSVRLGRNKSNTQMPRRKLRAMRRSQSTVETRKTGTSDRFKDQS